MRTKIAMILTMVLGCAAVSGCVPVAVGAAGAVAVDAISEDRGRDLF